VGIFSLLDKKANIYDNFIKPNLSNGKNRIIDLTGEVFPSTAF
jgi:hypothetical protein